MRGSQSHCGEVKCVVLCFCWKNKRNSRGVGKSVRAFGGGEPERAQGVKGVACNGDGEQEQRAT